MKKLRNLLLTICAFLLAYKLLLETGLMHNVTETWEKIKNSEFVTQITEITEQYFDENEEISTETLEIQIME